MLHIGGKLVLKLKRVMVRLCCVDWNIVRVLEALCSFEMLLTIYQLTWCNIAKDLQLQQDHSEDLHCTDRNYVMFLLIKTYGRPDRICLHIRHCVL